MLTLNTATAKSTLLGASALLLLCACQPTPEEEAKIIAEYEGRCAAVTTKDGEGSQFNLAFDINCQPPLQCNIIPINVSEHQGEFSVQCSSEAASAAGTNRAQMNGAGYSCSIDQQQNLGRARIEAVCRPTGNVPVNGNIAWQGVYDEKANDYRVLISVK